MIEQCCGTTRFGDPCNIKVSNAYWCHAHTPPTPTLEDVLAQIWRLGHE